MAEGIVKEAYAEVGKADRVRPDMVRFLSDDQFAMAAAVVGIMNREKPGASLMFGAFYAESANPPQIPFFVAACDYALIGEELFAASAYLTREPVLLASIVVQDWGKHFAAATALIGAILVTAKIDALKTLLTK